MLKRASIFIATTVMISGCVSPYVPPTGGPTATLTIPVYTEKWKPSGQGSDSINVVAKNSDGCAAFPSHRIIGGEDLPIEPLDKDFSLTINGDTDVFFRVTRMYARYFCLTEGWFHASRDHEYILNVEAPELGRGCLYTLIEQDRAGAKVPVKFSHAYHSHLYNKICDSEDKL